MDGMRVSTVVALCVCGLVAGTFAEVAYSRLSLRSRSSGSPTYGFAGVAGLRSMRTEDDTMCSCVNRTHSDESSQRTMPTPAVTETCAQPAQHRAPDLATDATSALTRLYSHNSSLSATGGSQVRVCMIVRTFAGHRNKLVALLASVLLWQHAHLTITLVDTGSEAFVDLPLIAELTSAISGRAGSVRISHWRRDAARSRFPQLGDLEDHGYVATDLAMEDVLEDRKAARLAGTPEDELPCNSLIITNGDNLYSFEYLAATLEAMAGGAELVSTHWVSHYDMKKEWILGWGEVRMQTLYWGCVTVLPYACYVNHSEVMSKSRVTPIHRRSRMATVDRGVQAATARLRLAQVLFEVVLIWE